MNHSDLTPIDQTIPISSVIRYWQSKQKEIEMYMRVGDVVHSRHRESSDSTRKRIQLAVQLKEQGWKHGDIAQEIKMAPSNLSKYLKEHYARISNEC